MTGSRRKVSASSKSTPRIWKAKIVQAPLVGKLVDPCRTGWAEASKALAVAGDDPLVLSEFANESD